MEDDKKLKESCGKGHHKNGPSRSIYTAPDFVKRLNAFEEAKAGTTVVFGCAWKGFPKPTIKWFKDDEEITDNTRYGVSEITDNGELTLTIKNAWKKDEGAYKCKAENQEGVTSTTGYLSITGDYTDRPLSKVPRKNIDHAVSNPPPLRSIIEQYSMEEREAAIQQGLLPEDLIRELQQEAGANWPMLAHMVPSLSGNDQISAAGAATEMDIDDSGSDTSVESQGTDMPYQPHTPSGAQPSEDEVLQIAGDTDGMIVGASAATINNNQPSIREQNNNSSMRHIYGEGVFNFEEESTRRWAPVSTTPVHERVPVEIEMYAESLLTSLVKDVQLIVTQADMTNTAPQLLCNSQQRYSQDNDELTGHENDTDEPVSPLHLEFNQMMFEVRQRIEKQKSPKPSAEATTITADHTSVKHTVKPPASVFNEAELDCHFPSEVSLTKESEAISNYKTTSMGGHVEESSQEIPDESTLLKKHIKTKPKIAQNGQSNEERQDPPSRRRPLTHQGAIQAVFSVSELEDYQQMLHSADKLIHEKIEDPPLPFPWLFSFAVSAGATFIGTSLQVSPLAYVFTIATISLISFIILFRHD